MFVTPCASSKPDIHSFQSPFVRHTTTHTSTGVQRQSIRVQRHVPHFHTTKYENRNESLYSSVSNLLLLNLFTSSKLVFLLSLDKSSTQGRHLGLNLPTMHIQRVISFFNRTTLSLCHPHLSLCPLRIIITLLPTASAHWGILQQIMLHNNTSGVYNKLSLSAS